VTVTQWITAGVIGAFIVAGVLRALFGVVTEINIHDRGTRDEK
jgi:predicted benzoate:H+ symporter BenE